MTSVAVPIIRANGDGEKRWWFGGGLQTWKATAAETGGAFFLFEDFMTRGKVTPLHRHPDVDETFYVLEGEILLHIDGLRHRIETGGICIAPRGVPHAFLVTSHTARILTLVTPGNASAESFFRNASEPATAAHMDASGPVDFARVQESAKLTGATEILGPPPFEAPG